MKVIYIICIFFAVIISQFLTAAGISEGIFNKDNYNVHFYSTLIILSLIFTIIYSILFIPNITTLLHGFKLFICIGIIIMGVLYAILLTIIDSLGQGLFKLLSFNQSYSIIFSNIVVFFIIFLWLDNDFDKKKVLSKELDKYEIIQVDSIKNITAHQMFLFTKDEISIINNNYILEPTIKLDYIINKYNSDSTLVDKKLLSLNDSIKSILNSIQVEYSKVKSLAMNNDSIIGEFQYAILKDGRRKRYALLFCNNIGKKGIVYINRKKTLIEIDLNYLISDSIFDKIFSLRNTFIQIRPNDSYIDELFNQLKNNEIKSINNTYNEKINFD
ncbi:MAG: hypothetical protein AB7S48_00145 [Bacteroidales bacterium]